MRLFELKGGIGLTFVSTSRDLQAAILFTSPTRDGLTAN
jgi:hypothetical protein